MQQLSGEGTHGFTHFSGHAGMMLVGAGSVPACCQGNETSEGWCASALCSSGVLHGMCTGAVNCSTLLNCHCQVGPFVAVRSNVNNSSLQLWMQGALAAAVASSCSAIVIATAGSVNETPRISSARSTLHYRKSKLPHPRPAAARAVCIGAC